MSGRKPSERKSRPPNRREEPPPPSEENGAPTGSAQEDATPPGRVPPHNLDAETFRELRTAGRERAGAIKAGLQSGWREFSCAAEPIGLESLRAIPFVPSSLFSDAKPESPLARVRRRDEADDFDRGFEDR